MIYLWDYQSTMQNSVKRYKHITFAGSYTEEMQEKALDHGLFHLSISTKKTKVLQ